jgi:hypothetical protein
LSTKRFLEVFDLKDLNSLPKLKEIKDFAADQYEPTIINREVSHEGVSAEAGATEEGYLEKAIVQEGYQAEEGTETEADTGYEDTGLPGSGAEIDIEYEDHSEPLEDTYEEDDSLESPDTPDPEYDDDPEENGTET